MTLIDKIKKSVEGATGFPFLYHAAGEMNELIARAERLPVAFAFLIDSGTIEDVNGRYHERVTLAVMFTDKTQFDFNAMENEEIIDRMKVKAYKWLESLRNSNDLQIVSVNSTQRLYDTTTDVLTGYAVNITLQDMYGVGECELPEVVIDVDKNGSYNVVGVDKVRVNVVPKLEELEVTQNGEYLPPTDIEGFSKVNVDVQPTLEELTVTANGEYLPQEGVDGFSKVVANVVPTKRVVIPDRMRVGNELIIDGYWAGELVDTMCVTNAQYMFSNSLREVNVSKWDTSKITIMSAMFYSTQIQTLDVSNWNTSMLNLMNHIFNNCKNLQYIDVSNWDTSSVTHVQNAFYNCQKLQMLDLVKWDMSNVISCTSMLSNCSVMTSIVGYRTYDEVSSNNIGCLNGLKMSLAIEGTNNLDRASLRAVINGLADLTGQTAQTLTLGATLIAKLTEEDIAIATSKNWTIV